MQTFETPLTEDGQIIIPVEVLQILGLHSGDKVRFEVEDDTIRITRATSNLLAGYKAVTSRAIVEDDTTIREQFENGVAEEVVSE